MRSSSSKQWSATRVRSIILVLASSGFLAGCEESPPSQIPPRIVAETPEAKLEVAMDRLRLAITDAAAAQGSGVVSQRKSSYRLLRPQAEGEPYKAEVAIQTIVALVNAPAAATLPAREEEASAFDEEEEGEETEFKSDDEEADAATADLEEPTDNGVTRKATAQSKEVTTNVYNLVYDEDRWKLATEIDANNDEVAKYLFKFALSE